jgi:ribulose-phosphate 3-epimerase
MPEAVSLAVSLSSLPLHRLEDAWSGLREAGCAELLIEVSDGRFAPRFAFGPAVVASAAAHAGMPCAVYVTSRDPDRHIPALAKAGADTIVVHAEALTHGHRTLTVIKDAGCKAGIALRPATPLTAVDFLLAESDRVFVCATEPGLEAPSDYDAAAERIGIVGRNLVYRSLSAKVTALGGLDVRGAGLCAQAGATTVVLDNAALPTGQDPASQLADFKRAFDARLLAT